MELTSAGTLLHQNSQATDVNIGDSLEIFSAKNYWHWPISDEVICKYTLEQSSIFQQQCTKLLLQQSSLAATIGKAYSASRICWQNRLHLPRWWIRCISRTVWSASQPWQGHTGAAIKPEATVIGITARWPQENNLNVDGRKFCIPKFW